MAKPESEDKCNPFLRRHRFFGSDMEAGRPPQYSASPIWRGSRYRIRAARGSRLVVSLCTALLARFSRQGIHHSNILEQVRRQTMPSLKVVWGVVGDPDLA